MMESSRKEGRFQYSMKTERLREQRELVGRELPHRSSFATEDVLYYLTLQGYHLDEAELDKIAHRLFGKKPPLNREQMIGIVARLAVDDEVERELRRVFEFFSGGEDVLTAQDLRTALERLGETLKEREINQILADMDLNSNGYIDFETFLEAMLID